jgi:hypothetical protein
MRAIRKPWSCVASVSIELSQSRALAAPHVCADSLCLAFGRFSLGDGPPSASLDCSALVGDYAKEPGSQTRALAQVSDSSPRGDGSLLHRVLGLVDILQQPVCEPERRPVLGPKKVGECRAIAGSGRFDEVDLCSTKHRSQ